MFWLCIVFSVFSVMYRVVSVFSVMYRVVSVFSVMYRMYICVQCDV